MIVVGVIVVGVVVVGVFVVGVFVVGVSDKRTTVAIAVAQGAFPLSGQS